MGFKFTYHRFFSVSVKEDTTENEIRALDFNPTQDCIQLLENHHLIFRKTKNGFEVYYRSNPNGSEPIISPIEVKTKFSFSVKVRDPLFYSLYEPETSTLPQFYLDNISDPESDNLTTDSSFDSADLAIISKLSFTQRTDLTMDDPPTEWRIKEKFDPQDTIKTIPILNEDDLDFVQVSMNDPFLHPSDYISESGVYALETDKESFTQTTLYLSNELGRKSINGVLDIYWDNSQANAPDNTGKQYQIIFKPK